VNFNSGITNSRPGCGRPHTTHPLAKISKAKDLALILLISVFRLSCFHVLSNQIKSNVLVSVAGLHSAY